MHCIKLNDPLNTFQILQTEWEQINNVFKDKLEPYHLILRPTPGELYSISTRDCKSPVRKFTPPRKHTFKDQEDLRAVGLRIADLRKNLKNHPTDKNRQAFYAGIRALSEIKKKVNRVRIQKQIRYHERKFRENPWAYCERNLKDKPISKTPSDANRVVQHFKDTYKSPTQPIDVSKLPANLNPTSRYNESPIRPKHIRYALRKT